MYLILFFPESCSLRSLLKIFCLILNLETRQPLRPRHHWPQTNPKGKDPNLSARLLVRYAATLPTTTCIMEPSSATHVGPFSDGEWPTKPLFIAPKIKIAPLLRLPENIVNIADFKNASALAWNTIGLWRKMTNGRKKKCRNRGRSWAKSSRIRQCWKERRQLMRKEWGKC